MNDTKTQPKTQTLHVRVPAPLVGPLHEAAERMALSPNHFLRVCLAEKLAAGGLLPKHEAA
jgi:hypothetical protein